MATFNCFLKEVSVNEWTVEGGGTALEAIGKTTVEPTNPSTSKFLKKETTSKKVEAKIVLPAGLITALGEGGTVVAATFHVSAQADGTTGKIVVFGFLSPSVTAETKIAITQAWYTVSLSKAQAEELTKVKLEALTLLVETILSKPISLYEIYLSVQTEGEGKAHLAGTTTFKVGGSCAIAVKSTLAPRTALQAGGSTAASTKIKLAPTAHVRITTAGALSSVASLLAYRTFAFRTNVNRRVGAYFGGAYFGGVYFGGTLLPVRGPGELITASRASVASTLQAPVFVSMQTGETTAGATTIKLTGTLAGSTGIQVEPNTALQVTGSTALTTTLQVELNTAFQMTGSAPLTTSSQLVVTTTLQVVGAGQLATAGQLSSATTMSFLGTVSVQTESTTYLSAAMTIGLSGLLTVSSNIQLGGASTLSTPAVCAIAVEEE
jgi:hypothetical protein